ncbi:hypothetical protein MF271_21745 (plasmid) [Deinococcus sp. KNUC1210]|uniref:hypothetical protein n=1 Tax=Deinococcus sp. KNUC1210 TaxID=2917691 RepID=UPI001EF10659|nr:hypothetical protein [Deinococcus sp. KNUC1210]ULH17825.1 hypothetical protein MF271_21745 [Deinococcus sp. KNUC1210]
MRLLPRLFLSHTLVVVLAEEFASAFIQHHVEEMMALIGPSGLSLHMVDRR